MMNKKEKTGWYIICAVVIVFISIAAVTSYFNSKLPDNIFCIDNYDSRSHHIVVIDRTDNFNDGYIEAVRNYFINRIQLKVNPENANDPAAIKIQDLLTIYILDEENFNNKIYAVPVPFLSLCNPGNDPNLLVQSPSIVKDNFDSFMGELDEVYKNLGKKGTTPESPIFEMINSISKTITDHERTHIYIISDMLHNNDYYSQYRSSLTFEEFKKTLAGYYETVRPSINNVNVNVLYVRRAGERHLQTLKHEDFWKRYFIDNNASSIYFTRL